MYDSETVLEVKASRLQEPEDQGECCEILSPRYTYILKIVSLIGYVWINQRRVTCFALNWSKEHIAVWW